MKRTAASAAPEHLYEIVKNDLRAKILKNEFPPDSRIPSEVELIEQYQVSRITIRHAINELVEDGLLVKRPGKGTFVAQQKHSRHVIGINSFTEDCRRSGLNARTEVLHLGYGRASGRISRELHVPAGSSVINLDRLRYIDDEPVILEKIVFPPQFDQVFYEENEDMLSSVSTLLEKRLGQRLVHIDFTIDLMYVSGADAERLALRPNTAVLHLHGCTLDEDMKPVYYSDQLFVGDKVSLTGTKAFDE